MSHRLPLGLLAAAIGCLSLVPASASAATCSLSADDKYHKANNAKPTYTRSLKATGGASCATAKKMIGAYYKCRVSGGKGKKGRCSKKVLGYSCSEKRSNVIATQFDATATCRKGKARIVTAYTQFT
ncbi:hypothetical protein [Paraconexibacter algicola]|uniref:Uncharacterized protein n=1 Tax=Paraconexibacter algicola TaxID=2133960 RepID=A0A2T4UHZ8_9ACTN|nr:hypothetical protein [Paraconexibacter algicola]PTL58863.1 hypothetical protein C7Y72_03950 [Paraconexibacter algicola]